ncbi:MAG: IPT/TIG domain-containing protein [Bacteroidota bacterium]
MTKNAMNTSLILRRLSLFLLTILILSGCKKDPPASLYEPGIGQGAVPTIASVVPNDSALAGVTAVTITGTNFSPVKEYNFVYFNATPGTVLQASATQLVVKAPILIADSVGLKIAIQGVELFSNAIRYKLVAAVKDFGVLANTVEEPFGITCDTAGNVYVSLLSAAGTGLGVKKITPSGVRTDYSPVFSSSVNKWTSMKLGPGGYMYAAANRNAIFRIPPNGGNSAPWANTGSAGVSFVVDFDFDALGNIWGGGDNQKIVRVIPGAPGSPPLGSAAFPFSGNVNALRVFQNYLYLATKNDTVWNIWRTRVFSADSIGPKELYFNFTNKFGSLAGAYSMTFAADGDLFVGTDPDTGSLVVIHPDKSAERFYPGLFSGRIQGMAYGKGTEMYLSRTGSTDALKKILRVNTQKQGAPYYGRQ